jgi:hypothetical protein
MPPSGYLTHAHAAVFRVLLAGLLGLMLTACVPEPVSNDAGPVSALKVDQPKQVEALGATVMLVRRPNDEVVAYWGVSPLDATDNRGVRCFLIVSGSRGFEGQTNIFLDPCRNAWWDREGRFLGFANQADAGRPPAPALIRLPYELRDGRVKLDRERLICLQERGPLGCPEG